MYSRNKEQIGYRLNDGQLMPAFFNRETYPIPHIADNDVIDFYFSKDKNKPFRSPLARATRMTFDFKTNAIDTMEGTHFHKTINIGGP